ncbi:MAG: 3-deoxy-D-manno-octulosonic acid transferase, partial [Gammaproteobacteria bacterium]|nr:3-deoxy-D-manno-octulosonic acid transferase [Gammaproteobacteria bacterium]
VAFLGGSLVSVGGHNPIEAAICAQPLIMGPETFNFPDVVAAFSDAGCLFLVRDAEQLASRVTSCLADNELRAELGQAAHKVVTENTGATGRLLDLLRAEIRSAALRG